MPVVIEKRGEFKAEDLLRPGTPEKFVEIIEGDLVEMTPSGKYHNRIAFHFHVLFQQFSKSKPDLDFGGDNEGFLLQRDPDLLLSPDACLFRKRPPTEKPWLEFSPEIAVEVLSPSNNPSEMAYKIRKYFEGGSEQVWIANPENQSIEFCHCDGRRVVAEGKERIQGESIAEGMVIDLSEIFDPDG